jgi:hypothetical protein
VADNYKIGTAYLQVIPQLEGDYTKSINDALRKAGEAGGKAGGAAAGAGMEGGLSAKAVAIGNIISGAIMAGARAGADALGSILGDALAGFSSFEQLEGGVQKLFGDSATQVLDDAAAAFQTAGMSANQYMENVTGFSSSLISSLGGDTAQAAQIANMAIIDMADNINTFGGDIGDVTRAYQGFAKQNYTMLDNLKLGYGGTRSEMERLLATAESITGVHYDISNLADVYTAIHVIQESMGIMGKTSEEALSTVEGSVNALRASWANWLAELGKPDADMGAVTEQLVESFEAAARNVGPAMGRIIVGIVSTLPGLVADAMAALPDLLSEIFASVFSQIDGGPAGEALAGITTAWGEAFAAVGESASVALGAVGEVVEQFAPQLQLLGDIVGQIAAVLLGEVLPFVFSLVGSGVIAFIAGVASAVISLLGAVGQLVGAIIAAPAQIMAFFTQLQADITNAFASAASSIQSTFDGVVSYFAGIPGQIVGFFSGIASDIGSAFASIKLPSLHITGSLNPVDWITTGNMPQIGFYASGGVFDRATLGVFGEAGPEAIVPLTPSRLQPFGEAVKNAMGGAGQTTIYIDGARVNDSQAVESLFYSFMQELARLGAMG